MLYKTEYRSSLPDSAINFDETKISLNEPTGRFFYDKWDTKPEYRHTFWHGILESLPFDKGEARVIKLDPGTTYMSHTDIDDRWHLTLQAEKSYLIDLDDEKMFPTEADGIWYKMDAGKRHVASNFGSIPRLQLVVRKLLKESQEKNLVNVKISPKQESYDYRYKFDNIISPWLNKTNKKGLIKDFDYSGHQVTFKTTKEALETLPKAELFRIDI
jgi:hypothetical protein